MQMIRSGFIRKRNKNIEDGEQFKKYLTGLGRGSAQGFIYGPRTLFMWSHC